jgi:hypothetical protein
VSASPRLDAAEPATGTDDAGATPPPAERTSTSGPSNRVPRRLAAAGLVAALIGGGVAIQQVRVADAEATAAEQRTARADLAADLGEVRRTIADPARSGQGAASALLRHQLLLIAGDRPDGEVGERLVADLRTAADELGEAATTPMPERPTILPVATVDPIYDRLSGLEDQAADLAGTYRDAADEAETALAALTELETAALRYADESGDVPTSDDPDTVASAWRAERDRLETYRAAVDAAAQRPATAQLAEAHDGLVSGMEQLTADALERLEDGDLDGYNALIAERLGGDDPFGFAGALEAARTEASDAAIDGPLEDARARGLGLLTELEELRRITPAQLAEVG